MSAEVAWAAGLFEGEGCFTTIRASNKPGNVKVRAQLEMTDEEVVRRFAHVVGCGTVRERHRHARKPLYIWHVDGKAAVVRLGELLSPWLGERRQQRLTEVVAEREEYESRIPAIRVAAARRSGETRRKATT